MAFEIEIIEGHDPSSYFWFRPVILHEKGDILWDEVIELEDEFSIEEDDIRHFLYYFLEKFFDQNLTYNKRRYEVFDGYISGFKWYLTYNFYTYEVINKMIDKINDVANLLENDYENPSLDKLKEKFSIDLMTPENHPDHSNKNAIKKHINVVIDFYRRFSKRISKMMADNPQPNIISVMGP